MAGMKQLQALAVAGMASMALLGGCQTVRELPMMQGQNAAPACPEFSPGSGIYTPPFPAGCADVVIEADGRMWLQITAGPQGKPAPVSGSTVIVAYEGYLAADGTRIDSSYKRGEPAIFDIDDVLEGWTRTLKQMTAGDEWLVYIPADLAYGSEARGDAVPPDSDLVFKIRLDGSVAPDDMAGLQTEPDTQAAGVDESLWDDFLPWDQSRDGVQTLKSGLSYIVLETGGAGGRKAYADDIVAIDYEARLAENGATVSSTWMRDAPLLVRAGDLIPGFAQLVSLMKPGDVWIGRVPAAIAYGDQGLGDAVPPAADLIYLVNLVSVNPETAE